MPRSELRPFLAPAFPDLAEVEEAEGAGGRDLADGHRAVEARRLRLQRVGGADDLVLEPRLPEIRLLLRRAAGFVHPQHGGVGNAVAPRLQATGRSEERRVGQEGVSPCRSRWVTNH